MRKWLLAGVGACVIAGAGFGAWAAQPAAPAPAPAGSTAAERFKALYTEEWKWRSDEFGSSDDTPADGRALPDHLPHETPADHARRLAYWEKIRERLAAIDPAALPADDRVNYAIYRMQLDNMIASERFRAWEMPLNSDSAFWSNLTITARRGFRTAGNYRNYLGQLNDMPRYFREQTANMRSGLKRGFSVPRVTLNGRDKSIADIVEASDPEKNPFYQPFLDMPSTIPAAQQAELRAEARKAILESVIPAHRELLAFMREEYLPKTRTTLAAEALPDGKAFYRQQIREYTTLDLSPEEIHRIGLDEVARIHAEMQTAMQATGFKGTFAEFLTFLRTDPRFYAKTPEELLYKAAWISKKVDGKASRYFGRLPRGRFEIVPVPDNIAPYYTSARGGPHTYYLNTYNLPSRPLYTLTALTLHESALGHSFQLSLAEEQGEQPAFRSESYISAYGEGWGLYVEKLGKEMGLYETPYDEFGRLTFEMWRAARLVVDTGIHHKGWTRDQAIRFMADNTALSMHDIEIEIDRYISWPGQALSYKLGEIEIWRQRRKAEAALGEKFDIRAFHDTVLSMGSVPLPVLAQRIDQFIAEGGKGPYPIKGD
jgi:uncharacterized protein (DUF885 family)